MATDFLDQTRSEITARLTELKPLVDEYTRLEAAAAALAAVPTSTAPRAASRARGAHASRATSGTPRRGRPKGSGTRAKQALELVKATPGITVPQIAGKLGIKQNYLYRVLAGLADDGLVVKDGTGWRAAGVTA